MAQQVRRVQGSCPDTTWGPIFRANRYSVVTKGLSDTVLTRCRHKNVLHLSMNVVYLSVKRSVRRRTPVHRSSGTPQWGKDNGPGGTVEEVRGHWTLPFQPFFCRFGWEINTKDGNKKFYFLFYGSRSGFVSERRRLGYLGGPGSPRSPVLFVPTLGRERLGGSSHTLVPCVLPSRKLEKTNVKIRVSTLDLDLFIAGCNNSTRENLRESSDRK